MTRSGCHGVGLPQAEQAAEPCGAQHLEEQLFLDTVFGP